MMPKAGLTTADIMYTDLETAPSHSLDPATYTHLMAVG